MSATIRVYFLKHTKDDKNQSLLNSMSKPNSDREISFHLTHHHKGVESTIKKKQTLSTKETVVGCTRLFTFLFVLSVTIFFIKFSLQLVFKEKNKPQHNPHNTKTFPAVPRRAALSFFCNDYCEERYASVACTIQEIYKNFNSNKGKKLLKKEKCHFKC